MRGFASLLCVQARGAFGINRALHAHDTRQRLRLVLLGCCVALLAVLFGAYAGTYAAALAAVGARDAIPALAVALGSLAGVATTFLKANGQLFGFRDFDLVMSLPVPTWQVVLSRMGALYGMNLLFALVLAGPMLGVWAAGHGEPAQMASTAATMVLVCLCMPLLPMAVTTILAYGLAALAARMRRAKVAAGLLGLLAVIALIAGSLALSGGIGPQDAATQMAMLADMGGTLERIVCGAYPPAAWPRRASPWAIRDGWAASPRSSASRWRHPWQWSQSWRAGSCRSTPPWKAVRAAEASGGAARRADRRRAGVALRHAPRMRSARRWRRSRSRSCALLAQHAHLPPEHGHRPRAGPGGLGRAGSDRPAGRSCPRWEVSWARSATQTLTGADLEGLLLTLSPWVLALCLAIAPTSASATSLEGSARWIMQTAPLPARTIMGSKVAANLVLCVPRRPGRRHRHRRGAGRRAPADAGPYVRAPRRLLSLRVPGSLPRRPRATLRLGKRVRGGQALGGRRHHVRGRHGPSCSGRVSWRGRPVRGRRS